MTYQFAEINGVRMHYDVQGEGPPLVLLHEGIADLRMFDDQMPAFAPHFRVVRYDVRGFGQTPDPPGDYTEHGDLRALLEYFSVERAHVLGMSRSGRLAIDFAITYPEMVDKLVLVAPAMSGFDYPADPASDELDERADAARASGDFELAAQTEAQLWAYGPGRTADDVDRGFRERIVQLIRETVAIEPGEGEGHAAEPPAAGRLGEITARALVIIGEHDVKPLFAVVEALERGVPGIRRVDMRGTAHVPNMEKPDEFNRIVLDFLLGR
jgi:pimeloyl-ACP methyl ester carboxylesterase